jgi:flagellar basal body-associated protein FliL
MNNRKVSTIVILVIMSVLLAFAGGLAFAANGHQNKPAGGTPLTPELAAKKEMVRKQQQQRVTPEKRRAAADALKAERLRVHRAKQAVNQPVPASIDNK